MNKMKKDGVKYEQWKPQHLKRFKKIWKDIAEEEDKKKFNLDFKIEKQTNEKNEES